MIELLLVSALAVSNHTIGDLQAAKAKPEVELCFQSKKLGTMLYAKEQHVNGHRVNVQGFDRNGDGEQDLLLVYEYVGTHGNLRPFPTAYMIDSDYDGNPDLEYMDAKGDGRCVDMVKVPIGSAFTGKRVAE